MKNIYIDTNVILSYYKPNEIFHNAARKILNSKRIKLISSDLTIIELCSSISRQYSQNEIKISSSAQKILEKEDEFTQIMALIKYILLSLNIEFFSNPGTQNFKLNNFKLDMCLDFYQTFYISPRLKLRTLDNLHIGALFNIVSLNKIKVDYLCTNDDEILNQKKIINEITGATPINPNQLKDFEVL
ncbi:MAG: type II toxin-antitoxin system VapC family toxin [Candidatus Helarchaeota archaeon]